MDDWCICWKSAVGASLTAQQAVRDKVIEDCRATPHVTVTQRPSTNQQTVRDKVMEYSRATVAQRSRNALRDCRATTVDQSANGARQVYGVLSRHTPRDCRATPHVTAVQRSTWLSCNEKERE